MELYFSGHGEFCGGGFGVVTGFGHGIKCRCIEAE